MRPTQETTDAVNAWLSAHNITTQKTTPAGNLLKFSATVAQANQLLDTQFSTFTHEESGVTSVRTLAYSIPADLVGHVEMVHPTIS